MCALLLLLLRRPIEARGINGGRKTTVWREGRAKKGTRPDENNFRGAANWQSDDK